MFPDSTQTRKRISQQLSCDLPAQAQENPQRTASLDELAEPNYYSKSLETSSTRSFASHRALPVFDERCAISLQPRPGSRRLPILASASTLQVFQFINAPLPLPACKGSNWLLRTMNNEECMGRFRPIGLKLAVAILA